jgi:hypothetical protein
MEISHHQTSFENSFESTQNESLEKLSQRLLSSFSFGHFTDFEVTIGFKKERIQAHRMVLYASSNYFQNYFTNNPNSTTIHFDDFEIHPFIEVLRWMYSGDNNRIDSNNALDILFISDVLEIPYLLNICCQFFSTKSETLLESKVFLKFSSNVVNSFISSDYFYIKDEFSLFQRIIQWSKGDKKKVESMKPFVRFTLIPIDNLMLIEKQGYLTINEMNSIYKKIIKKEIENERKELKIL